MTKPLAINVRSVLNDDESQLTTETFWSGGDENIRQRIQTEVLHLKEKSIAQALINAGWTPPAKLQDILQCRYPVCKSIHPSGWGWDIPRLNEVVDQLGRQKISKDSDPSE